MRFLSAAAALRKVFAALLFTATVLVAICSGQTPGSFDGCPLEGKTTKAGLMALVPLDQVFERLVISRAGRVEQGFGPRGRGNYLLADYG
jgi:hypothetical protein